MYIDGETIIQWGKVVTALAVLGGVAVGGYKFWDSNRRQTRAIRAIQTEQTLLCYGILACLKGLREQGCNGPVTDALDRLEKHLNKTAHEVEA